MSGVERHQADGATFLHPFDCKHLIAGHATLGLELVEQVPDLDTVVVCCGGGGLLAGVAYADGVVLITEDQIREACLALHGTGLVVEPSGSAALAAVLAGKVTTSVGSSGSLAVVL